MSPRWYRFAIAAGFRWTLGDPQKVRSLTLNLAVLSAVNLALSLLFQWYVLTQIGPGGQTDALFAGMAVPQFILAIIGSSLTHVLVPLLAGADSGQVREDAWAFVYLIGVAFGAIALLLIASSAWWVGLLLPGFDPDGLHLALKLVRVQLIGMVFAATGGVQVALYHAQGRFLWPEVSQLLIGACILGLLVVMLPRWGVSVAAWLATLRLAAQSVALLPAMGRPRAASLANPMLHEAWRRIRPLIVGTAYYKTDPLVDRFLLSFAVSGSMSLYYLAQQIYGAVTQILARALVAPLVPALGRAFKLRDSSAYRRAWQEKLLVTLAICFVAVGGLVLLGLPILRLLVGHGSVTDDNVRTLWWIMIWLAGMFVGGAVGQVAAPSFYAQGDTRTPTRISIWTYTGYVPAKLVAFALAGVKGLALLTSAYYLLNALLLLRGLLIKDDLGER